jgi:hypothetical protein
MYDWETFFDLAKVLSGIIMFIGIAYSLGGAGLSAWLASRKGYSAGTWFFLGLLFGVIALLAVGLAPNRNQAQTGEVKRNGAPSSPVYNAMTDKELKEMISRSEGEKPS